MDDQLTRALRSLPRDQARPGFAEAVRRRLEERNHRRSFAVAPLRLAVAAACLLLLVLGAREWRHHHQRQQTAARLAALESESRILAAELESLRRQLTMAEPVVYLGGNNDLDLVLDLAQLQRTGLRPQDLRGNRLPGSEIWNAGPPNTAPRFAAPGPAEALPAHFQPPINPTIY